MRDQRDVGILIDGHHPIMVLETADERLAMIFLSRLAGRRDLPLYQWTQTDGVRLVGAQTPEERFLALNQTREPQEVLLHIKSRPKPGCYVLCDLHPFLVDPYTVRLLKDIVLQDNDGIKKVLVLMSHRVELPGELRRYSTHFALPFPNERQLLGLINNEIKTWSATNRGAVSHWDINDMQSIARSLEGYSFRDAKIWVKNAVHREQVAMSGDRRVTVEARKRLFLGMDALHYEFDLCTLNELAGYANYKNWLARQRATAQEPKSILIFGAEGCGKSRAATATSAALSLPILHLDISRMGEITEAECIQWLTSLEALGGGMLWIDRIDQYSLSMTDASRTLMDKFLKRIRSRYWIIATGGAQTMPFLELNLAQNFTERFFVDMPHFEVRKEIIHTHFNLRQINESNLNLRELATLSDGLSGSQIEQSMVEAMHTAAAHGEVLEDAHFIAEISVQKPAFFESYDYLAAQRKWVEAHALTVD